MHLRKWKIALSFLFLPVLLLQGQEEYTGNPAVTVPENCSPERVAEIAATVTPALRQLKWQQMELTTFLHFSPNTYYDQEWGKGNEDAARFNPAQFDANQWVKVCKEAGSKCIIITAKHHDGFCLWPSKYTSHSVAASPWKSGQGDILRELSDACHKAGVGFGVYLSPWDRHEPSYGSEAYNTFFLNQLTELLTQYGKVTEVWFDGACGEGPNGKKQVYDWAAYYSLIRKLQPEAVIAVMGPDVRWVGTESGYGRETEWSVVPMDISNQEDIAGNSQQSASSEGFIPSGDMTNQDLGSREIIAKSRNLIWYPSEVDVSIRPGWFWHESENERVKTAEKLLDIYFNSVGKNSVLLLNIPPDQRGLIHENDIASLNGWRYAIDNTFKINRAEKSQIHISGSPGNINGSYLFDRNDATHISLPTEKECTIDFDLGESQTFDVLMLQENIRIGQRIEKFRLDAKVEGKWKNICRGTTVGYKRLLRFDAVTAKEVRLIIEQSKLAPALSEFGLFIQPPSVQAQPATATFKDSVRVTLSSQLKGVNIYYTIDGSSPDINAIPYEQPILLQETTKLKFVAITSEGIQGFCSTADYGKSSYNIRLENAADPRYDGGGPMGLTDGIRGSMDHADGRWTGFPGKNLEATIDLGINKPIEKIGISFLEETASWIFKPQQVAILVSDDGVAFKEIYSISNDTPTKDQSTRFSVSTSYHGEARYIKIIATPQNPVPNWHPGAGTSAWIFADEISIE
ncbi:MAG: alpha-L-fucosidase [Bacteroidales bacterium]|nr:alpha-L-fucosidase [Bacteroidales bacterium]